MLVKVKKKTVILILLFFLIPISFIIVFKRDWIFKGIDPKYDKLIEYCDYIDGSIEDCIALIKDVEQSEGQVCFDLSIVSDGYELVDTQLCEDESLIDWDSDVIPKDNERVPIFLDLSFRNKLFAFKILSKAVLDIMPDEDIYDLLNESNSQGIYLPNLRTQEMADIYTKGYYYSTINNTEEEENLDLQYIVFRDFKINQISKENDTLLLEGVIKINEKNYGIKIPTRGLNLRSRDDELEQKFQYITTENIDNFALESEFYEAFLYYIDEKSGIEQTDSTRYCKQNDLTAYTKDVLCAFLSENAVSDIVISDIDNYINEVINENTGDSLMFEKLLLFTLF